LLGWKRWKLASMKIPLSLPRRGGNDKRYEYPCFWPRISVQDTGTIHCCLACGTAGGVPRRKYDAAGGNLWKTELSVECTSCQVLWPISQPSHDWLTPDTTERVSVRASTDWLTRLLIQTQEDNNSTCSPRPGRSDEDFVAVQSVAYCTGSLLVPLGYLSRWATTYEYGRGPSRKPRKSDISHIIVQIYHIGCV
jgi:hypothetical protein